MTKNKSQGRMNTIRACSLSLLTLFLLLGQADAFADGLLAPPTKILRIKVIVTNSLAPRKGSGTEIPCVQIAYPGQAIQQKKWTGQDLTFLFNGVPQEQTIATTSAVWYDLKQQGQTGTTDALIPTLDTEAKTTIYLTPSLEPLGMSHPYLCKGD